MADSKFRIERDSLGIVEVPETAAWGPQTQRAVENFRLSGGAMPRRFIRALGLVKWAAARSNAELGLLDPGIAGAIADAAMRVTRGELDTQFPVDIFQTGSGTSSNMNANEVIARLASDALGQQIHANDHVNMCQSSNDVIPTTIHVAAMLSWSERLGPALGRLSAALARQESQFADIVKTGRTHLMDALPLTLGQEISAWRSQVDACAARLHDCLPRLRQLALGATAVGTGANADVIVACHRGKGGNAALLETPDRYAFEVLCQGFIMNGSVHLPSRSQVGEPDLASVVGLHQAMYLGPMWLRLGGPQPPAQRADPDPHTCVGC